MSRCTEEVAGVDGRRLLGLRCVEQRVGSRFVRLGILLLAALAPLYGQNPVISGLYIWPLTNNSATIGWVTDQYGTSVVNYGLSTAYGQTASTSGTNIYHAVPLSNLIAGTTYHYQMTTATASGSSTTSGDYTFTTSGTAPAPSGPNISNVAATNLTASGAVVTWTTDQPSSSQVNYGTSAAYGYQSPLNSNLATSQAVTLSGLQAGTVYYFDVVSTDSGGTSTSSNYTFTTA